MAKIKKNQNYLTDTIVKYKQVVVKNILRGRVYVGFNLYMTNIRDVLAKNMKAYRNALGLSQAKLAEKVDTSTHYIGMIEVKKNFPSPEMLERIAAALGIDTLDLFSTERTMPDAMKACCKSALKELRCTMGRIFDEKIAGLEKNSDS